MNQRQLKSKVNYLRKLYSELDTISQNAKTENGKIRSKKASEHLKCSVTLLIDTFDSEFKK
jgi:hypothetical protein